MIWMIWDLKKPGWCTIYLVGGLGHGFYFSMYWESYSQLTNIVSEGLKPPIRYTVGVQYDVVSETGYTGIP